MTTTFADLPLHGDVQRALASMRFRAPSPIQLRALPLALFGNDVIGQAKSGTGKTAVFGVTAVEHVIAKCDARALQQASGTTADTESGTQYTFAIVKRVDPLALILAPTREIAAQIDAVIRQIACFRPACAIQTVIGGLPIAQDRENLKHGCHIVIGTPGRVKALIEQRILQCHALRLLILDEVDKLMQSDFEREIVRVRGPQDVTVELVSSLEELAAWMQREESNQPELWLRHVKQFYSIVPKRPVGQQTNGNSNSDTLDMSSKIVKLAALLSEIVFNQCIVFCNDKFRAEALATALAAQGWPAVCITGSQSQATRTQVMESFRAFQARVLVSTDLTARGIDIDRVNFVVNLDLPRDPATYLHRVGRTGRFGGRISFLLRRVCLNLDLVRDDFDVVILYGLAVTLLAEDDVVAVEILARVFKMSIDELPEPVPRAIYDFVKEKSADRSEDVGPGAPELESSLTTTLIGEEKEARGEGRSIERSQKVEAKPKLLENLKMKSSGVTRPSSETRTSTSSGESESELDRQQDPMTEKLLIPIQEQQPPVAPESSENPSKVLPTSVSAANSAATPPETSTRKSEMTRSTPLRSATHAWEEECYARWTALLSRAKKRTLRSKKLIPGSASMWGWLTGNSNGNGNGNGSGSGRHRLGSIFSRPREFTLASMRHLHVQLLKFAELGDAEIVELLRVLSEFLIYSDQNHGPDDDGSGGGGGGGHDSDASSAALSPPRDSLEALEFERTTSSAGVFFDYFCEKNILGLFVQLGASKPSVAVQIQLLQTMSILVQNIATRTSLYYILSNNYVNKLLECPFAVMKEDDVRDWYVTLLKALSLRLNEETVQFFFDDSSANAFPLYSQALKFKRCSETMVKVAVKTLTLNVYKVQDDRVRQFILAYQKMAYFRDIVEYANELALKIQGLLNLWSPSMAQTLIEKLEEAIDEYIDHCFYLQDILDVNLPELCYKVGDLIYKRHVRKFLAASVLPDCNPPPQRVSTRLALYLLTRLTGIFEHAPLVNAISFMLLSPDASERCPYSAVALGAGSRRKTTRKSTTAKPSQASTTGNTATAAIATPATAKRKGSKKKAHVFQAHSAAKCDSPLCYLQTRFSEGEWPLDEVEKFVPSQTNCFRQSILALIASSDEILSSEALLLILAIVNNDAVDHTLLRELDLLPFRHRKHRRSGGGALGVEATGAAVAAGASLDALRLTVSEETGGSGESVDSGAEEGENETEDQEQAQLENSSVVSSTSSSDLSVSSTSQVEDDDDNDNDENDTEDASADSDNNSSDEIKAALIESMGGRLSDASSTHSSSSSESYVGQYPHWLMDTILSILAKNPETRLLSTQLAARLLLDIMLDPQRSSSSGAAADALHHWLLPRHGAVLKEIHSVSTHQVMESMRGAMADVDLFIYVLEDEFEDFQRTKFPMALNFKNASPFEFLIPPVLDFISDRKGTLNLRSPSNEMEVCRKSMRVFLTLRKLRALVDEHYCADNLDQFVAFRHPHTSLLESVTPSGRRKRAMLHTSSSSSSSAITTVPLEGMVFLKCIWREQRFLHSPAKLLMVLNPEALVFVEKQAAETAGDNNKDDVENDANQGFVRLFAPIHRTYCSIDAKDDRVLHVTISSAVPVDGCRSYHKGSVKSSRSSSGTNAQQQLGELKSWHVSVLFENREDCRQAKAHVDLSRAEVRAFKLLQIEESLTTHVQITHSANAVSPKTKARKLSMDVEERRLKQEEQEQA